MQCKICGCKIGKNDAKSSWVDRWTTRAPVRYYGCVSCSQNGSFDRWIDDRMKAITDKAEEQLGKLLDKNSEGKP